MTTVKRVNAVSLAKIQGIIMAIFGLLGGIIMAGFGGMIGSLSRQAGAGGAALPAGFGLAFGVGGIIFLPIVYGILGFIAGLISGWIYNLVAKWVGGIELELTEKSSGPQA